ncbi:Kv channel-interacting protein 1 [Folsomia candida]|uniref:Kv channel-interacting protein 4 n=1 Tax=Folsomia candida TaxID=158441 RepID=A0A226DIZ7_FOLCA|nr:Kv channel-interacting protein 1 [Folsomia candida]XP_035713432.1 Kv channel-interacting protein 1 [Folsomia candida]OXA45505.1 Kv channel-interacting protein 4 [Folsomia candida]
MYGMVSSDHTPRPRKEPQQQQQQQQHGGEGRSRSHKSIYGRVVGFMRQAWTGVKFALDPDLDDVESPPRYRPESVKALCKLTRFSENEIKRIYRGFKAECPSGVVQEDTFRDIYAQFFPQGANTSHYAHYVFNTLDQGRSGLLNFEDFVMGLSVLSRGTVDEKLRWTFNLYDINRDGFITKEEMRDVVTAVYELMGSCAEPNFEESVVNDRVERIFMKMDQNRDGVVSMEEFLVSCTKDETITRSICVFDSVI